MPSELVIKRAPADAENRRSQFFISPDMREGHVDEFLFYRIQSYADSDGTGGSGGI